MQQQDVIVPDTLIGRGSVISALVYNLSIATAHHHTASNAIVIVIYNLCPRYIRGLGCQLYLNFCCGNRKSAYTWMGLAASVYAMLLPLWQCAICHAMYRNTVWTRNLCTVCHRRWRVTWETVMDTILHWRQLAQGSR